MTIDDIISFLDLHLMYIILSLILSLLFVWLYRQNRESSSPIDFNDLVLDAKSKRLSGSKTIRLGTWIITSWGFLYLLTTNSLEEWYAISYMAIWTGNALLRNRFRSNFEESYRQDFNRPYEDTSGDFVDPDKNFRA